MNRSRWIDAFRLIGLGWYVATSILLGVVVGLLIDGWVDTKPLFTLIGLGLGLTIAFYGLYRLVYPVLKRNDKEKD